MYVRRTVHYLRGETPNKTPTNVSAMNAMDVHRTTPFSDLLRLRYLAPLCAHMGLHESIGDGQKQSLSTIKDRQPRHMGTYDIHRSAAKNKPATHENRPHLLAPLLAATA